jgi:hypothetical protein
MISWWRRGGQSAQCAIETPMTGLMDAPMIEIKPRAWMFPLCFVAMAAGIGLMFVLPNPFGDPVLNQPPSKLIFLVWILAVVLAGAGLFRIIIWSSFQIEGDVLQRRSWLGLRSFNRGDLASSYVERVRGRPSVLVMRFSEGRQLRVVDMFYSKAGFNALCAFARAG